MRERNHDFSTFEYWIGYFMPEGTAVPEGFEHVDFPPGGLGVCWLRGRENEVYGREAECLSRLEKEGFQIIANWCFERYAFPRFETPDEDGNITLDVCFFIR